MQGGYLAATLGHSLLAMHYHCTDCCESAMTRGHRVVHDSISEESFSDLSFQQKHPHNLVNKVNTNTMLTDRKSKCVCPVLTKEKLNEHVFSLNICLV
jgi:hypothetical protein